MKSGIKDIVGRKISEVIVGDKSSERMQYVFLVFDDGTYFEFYGRDFTCAGGVDAGTWSDAASYLKNMGGSIDDIFPDKPRGPWR